MLVINFNNNNRKELLKLWKSRKRGMSKRRAKRGSSGDGFNDFMIRALDNFCMTLLIFSS
jgi:hypothetical protein